MEIKSKITHTILIIFLLVSSIVFLACQNDYAMNEENDIHFILPEWPPEYGDQTLYPELTGWLITTNKVRNQLVKADIKEIEVSVTKNKPFYLIAQPVTKSYHGDCTFFHCAGGLYPYCYERVGNSMTKQKGSVNVTWDQGFCAYIMDSLFLPENGLHQKKEREQYLASFNWKKYSETIQTKTEDSKAENPPKVFYNPWHTDLSAIKQGIAYKTFSATLLNQKNCFSATLDNPRVLAPYIPENEIIHNYSQVSLKKDEENYFSVNNQYQMIIRGSSVKNLSTDYIFLPIIIEE